MKPYLAIIRDSFHAALSSRVLWIAFVAIWLVLAALAPFGYEEDLTAEFRGARDLADRSLLRGLLAQGLKDPEMAETAVGRLAAAMPEEIAKELTEVSEGGKATLRTSTYADALNECLDDESWYDKEAWAPTLRLAELRELDELPDEELDESRRRRRARLRRVFGRHVWATISLASSRPRRGVVDATSRGVVAASPLRRRGVVAASSWCRRGVGVASAWWPCVAVAATGRASESDPSGTGQPG